MIRLADITPAAWVPVAVRVPAGAVDVWDWRLSPFDAATFRAAREIGRPFLTAQRREPDGSVVLLARRLLAPVAPTPARPPGRPRAPGLPAAERRGDGAVTGRAARVGGAS